MATRTPAMTARGRERAGDPAGQVPAAQGGQHEHRPDLEPRPGGRQGPAGQRPGGQQHSGHRECRRDHVEAREQQRAHDQGQQGPEPGPAGEPGPSGLVGEHGHDRGVEAQEQGHEAQALPGQPRPEHEDRARQGRVLPHLVGREPPVLQGLGHPGGVDRQVVDLLRPGDEPDDDRRPAPGAGPPRSPSRSTSGARGCRPCQARSIPSRSAARTAWLREVTPSLR